MNRPLYLFALMPGLLLATEHQQKMGGRPKHQLRNDDSFERRQAYGRLVAKLMSKEGAA